MTNRVPSCSEKIEVLACRLIACDASSTTVVLSKICEIEKPIALRNKGVGAQGLAPLHAKDRPLLGLALHVS